MKLIVGLGNPGKQYEKTRHNMGFLVLDSLAEFLRVDIDKEGFKGLYAIVKNEVLPEPVILLKPQTFMNLSGESVQPLMAYYKISPEDLIVVYDDMAIPEGKIRLRPFGSSGSHNGMKSIIARLGTDRFKRIRVGIGEPTYGGADYVLSAPKGESLVLAGQAISAATEALKDALVHGWDHAMNHFNG
ncbi:MAG: aminoacyl-tRNA hydrolase [Bacillales bacterium]|nr:aminoacyl-tRNA hydrolase [Bacillales bacterium]MDY5920030.1 aminoacyl-tRNA hydrolase [Candidatus Enteromonas sp.]